MPRADEITIDARVLLFALAASVVHGDVAGVLPAIRAGRTDLNDALKEGGRGDSGGVALRTRRVLIVCEVALSLVLLMGAGVMLRTLDALRRVDAGFDPANVLTLRLSLSEMRYKTPAQTAAFFDGVLQGVRALPGVETAAAIDDVPLAGGSQQPMVVDGRAELLPRDQPTVAVRKITPGYLRAMRVPLLQGRDVAENDADVVLVSRAAAKLLWGDGDPVGHEARLPLQSKTQVLRVIGCRRRHPRQRARREAGRRRVRVHARRATGGAWTRRCGPRCRRCRWRRRPPPPSTRSIRRCRSRT